MSGDVSLRRPAELGLLDALLAGFRNWRLIAIGTLSATIIAIAVTFVIAPTYTARTTLLPPQQQSTGTLAALSQLGALSGLATSAVRTPADQYVAFMQSVNVRDRLIDRFNLAAVYEADFRHDARNKLAANTRMDVGKKDGLIAVEVDDHNAQRAAEIANGYVEELRRLTSSLAVTEAQQRRVFFDNHMKKARDDLATAQRALQASGFDERALRVEPKAAAEAYAQLQSEITATEVRLQALLRTRTEAAAEVAQTRAALSALRAQLNRLERNTGPAQGPDYVNRYREFKYQEALFEMFSRQYEAARVDESREGTLIQVIDRASPPERRSSPKRAKTALIVFAASLMAMLSYVAARDRWRRGSNGASV